MKKIRLTNSDFFALVDDEDYERVSGNKWRASKNSRGPIYAIRHERKGNKLVAVFLHKQILLSDGSFQIDHVNRNGLDNRKQNLRLATHCQNLWNQTSRKGSRSRFKGVYYKNRAKNKWQAQIRVNYKLIHLGSYSTEEAAALAYDLAALKYQDAEFSCFNLLKTHGVINIFD